jgi:hypothetical protein
MPESDAKPNPDQSDPPASGVWAHVRSELHDADIALRLDALAKQGNLAGYAHDAGCVSFSAFGSAIDYRVSVLRETPGLGAFVLRAALERKPIWILIATTVVTIWPGSWLTDSMLRSYFSGYDWNTYAWYIPLTVLPMPWLVMRMLRGSRRAAWEHFQSVLPRVVAAIDGSVVASPGESTRAVEAIQPPART